MHITGGKVFYQGQFVDADLVVEGELIAEVRLQGEAAGLGASGEKGASDQGADSSDSGNAIDAAGCYVIPGLVDIHSHGAVGYDFCDATHEALDTITRYEARRGVTAYCPATMTYPEETLANIMRTAAVHADASDAAALVGINMEGPFISPDKVGAQNPAYVQAPDAAMFRRLQQAAGGLVKIVDIAPEEPGAAEFIDELHDEVRISLAHTCADYGQASDAFKRGACHVTHLYNAMPPLHHRNPGVIGAAVDAGATPEIIADGVHIHASAVRAAFEMFGPERMILISDSMMATGLSDGEYSLGGQPVTVRGNLATLHDGTLAGSATDLMGCLRVAVRDMGIALEDAVCAASENPARAIGIFGERGSLETGKIADAVVLDANLETKAVIVRGRSILPSF